MDNQASSLEQITSTPMPTARKPKDWFKILLVAAGFLIALGLFGNIYLLLRKEKPKPISQIVPTPTQTSLPRVRQPADLRGTPTHDPTANWKTYTNAKYGFSLKYPTGASVVGDAENINANKISGQIVSISGTNLDLTVNFTLGTPQNSIIKSDEKYTNESVVWTVRFIDPKGNCSPGLGPCTPILDYQSILNDNLVTFTFRGNYANRAIPTQILSTFKFLD